MSQQNLYLTNPGQMESRTTIVAVRQTWSGPAVVLRDNIHRPAGGGEPADKGIVVLDGGNVSLVTSVEKVDDQTWIGVQNSGCELVSGVPITARIDAEYRNSKRRHHTLIHTVLAVATRRLPGLSVGSADISSDAAKSMIVASWSEPVRDDQVAEIDAEVRSIVLQARTVIFDKVKSLEHARERYGRLFRVSDRYSLSGRIRLVVIDGLDANPCSGTHFESTNVGPYEIKREMQGYGVNQLAITLRLTPTWMYWYGPEPR